MFCFFESSDSGLTRYGGKSLEKLFERLSSFQIVEEGLDWDSRSTKHRSSAKNIPVFDDDSHETIVSWRMEHPNGKLGCSQKAFFGIKARPPAKGGAWSTQRKISDYSHLVSMGLECLPGLKQ